MKLNLFKKKTMIEVSNVDNDIVINDIIPDNVPENILDEAPNFTVEEILKEFDSSFSEFTSDIKNILNNNLTDELKIGKRLHNLGFTNTASSQAYQQYYVNKRRAIIVNRNIDKLKLKYPGYKFIASRNLNTICEKFALIHGEIIGFNGIIPEKNLNDIEQFQKIFDKQDSSHRYTDSGYIPNDMIICAPPSMFLENFLRYNSRTNKLEYNFTNNDPIVLQEVKIGEYETMYIIITAWGPEAQDEQIFNQQHN